MLPKYSPAVQEISHHYTITPIYLNSLRIIKTQGDWKQQNTESLLNTKTYISQRYLFFLDMAPCHWVYVGQRFEATIMCQNIMYQSPSNAVPHPKRTKTSTTLLQKPEVSHISPSTQLLML
jgi:hypothetical protein